MQLNALRSIILSIAEARSLTDVLEQIVSGIASVSEVALARVWLLENDSACPICSVNSSGNNEPALHLLASVGQSKDGTRQKNITGRSHKISVGERKIGFIAKNREALLVSEVSREMPWVADPDWITREEIKSFGGHPLICRGELLGVLAVFSRAPFSEEEFAWLKTFADHAAVAIWNARAFDELNRLRTALELENEYLHEEVKSALSFGGVIGQSQPLQKVMQQVELVAETDATVLILGESGVGKELVARAIHERGARRARPFIKVNCGAIPENLFESEFFGHVKGSFTGAIKDRMGRFELADGGDIFLDEVGEIPLALQSKLLRVLQEKQFERIGEARTRSVNVRIIAATNRDLKREVQLGKFREDLFYRLSVFPVEVPPLRERKDDIPMLAAHFLKTAATRMNIAAPRLTRNHISILTAYAWPGNVRELENVIERALILSKNSGHLHFDLPMAGAQFVSSAPPPEIKILDREEIRKTETENILAALRKTNGRVFGPRGAALLLGKKPTTLASKIKALGLQRRYVANS